jgi:site-specific DNA-cytosine methylase
MTSKAAKGIINRAMIRNKQIPSQFNMALHQVALQEQDMTTIDESTLIDIRVFHNHGFSVWKEDTHTAGTLVARDGKGARHFVVAKYANKKTIVRRLSEIEYERLMGWNDDHTRFRADGTETPRTQRYKMCGNGVVAPVATWIAQRITPILKETNYD